jgi:hypothetical protein
MLLELGDLILASTGRLSFEEVLKPITLKLKPVDDRLGCLRGSSESEICGVSKPSGESCRPVNERDFGGVRASGGGGVCAPELGLECSPISKNEPVDCGTEVPLTSLYDAIELSLDSPLKYSPVLKVDRRKSFRILLVAIFLVLGRDAVVGDGGGWPAFELFAGDDGGVASVLIINGLGMRWDAEPLADGSDLGDVGTC